MPTPNPAPAVTRLAAALADSPTARDLLADLEDALARVAPDARVQITTLDDDEEQPRPFGVWVVGPVDGDTDNEDEYDLIGTGEALSEALAEAIRTVEVWS